MSWGCAVLFLILMRFCFEILKNATSLTVCSMSVVLYIVNRDSGMVSPDSGWTMGISVLYLHHTLVLFLIG